jgi:hypothetical protein
MRLINKQRQNDIIAKVMNDYVEKGDTSFATPSELCQVIFSLRLQHEVFLATSFAVGGDSKRYSKKAPEPRQAPTPTIFMPE